MPCHQGETCSECLSLNTSAELNCLHGQAMGPMPVTTNFKYYSYDQLCETLTQKNTEKDAYRLEVSHSMFFRHLTELSLQLLNLTHKYANITTWVSDHKHFLQVAASNDHWYACSGMNLQYEWLSEDWLTLSSTTYKREYESREWNIKKRIL